MSSSIVHEGCREAKAYSGYGILAVEGMEGYLFRWLFVVQPAQLAYPAEVRLPVPVRAVLRGWLNRLSNGQLCRWVSHTRIAV
jgi:hypothetical protein